MTVLSNRYGRLSIVDEDGGTTAFDGRSFERGLVRGFEEFLTRDELGSSLRLFRGGEEVPFPLLRC